ncbi:MAG TPA: ABC transporter permease [Candidatus Limnocylindrales bacterium]|nr:ABC transporter permease [Candidatus Limnocylindrales bacterium]
MASMKRILADMGLYGRELVRGRTFLVSLVISPIILMLAFGAVFSFFSSGSSGPVNVYLQNQDNGQVSAQFINALNGTGTLRVELVGTSENFTNYLLGHSASYGIFIPANFSSSYAAAKPVKITVYVNPSSSSSAVVSETASGVINAFNLNRYGGSAIISMNQTTVNPKVHKYIDFLIPGLIGLTILLISFETIISLSAEYKKTKLFKQLSMTPLTKTEWLTSKALWYVLLTAISIPEMIAVGVFVFGANITLSVWLIPFIILGPMLFSALGMLAGTLTKDPAAANTMMYIIIIPMMLLSGVFYPLTSLPIYLQYVAHILPLTYVIEGLSAVMIYGNYMQAAADIAVLIVITIILFVAATKLYNWRED